MADLLFRGGVPILSGIPLSRQFISQEPLEGKFSDSCITWREPSKMPWNRGLKIGAIMVKLEAAK